MSPPTPIKILLLADSHLGFDLPLRPRVERRRRGHDFLTNHDAALRPALSGEVDLVVHGGDLFHRPRVPPSLVFQAFRCMLQVADAGVPVFVVPGNHEGSRIPHQRLAHHPNLHIFRKPETRLLEIRGHRVALTGFPYQRRRIRERFRDLLQESGWHREQADVRLLCMHHCVEGASVGPKDYTFRNAPDVIRCADLPAEFAAVLSGHIHRHQVLRQDLKGDPLSTPVLYPGSVERTAFAEIDEEKGYLSVEVEPGGQGGRLVKYGFVPLPARPMLMREVSPENGSGSTWRGNGLRHRVKEIIADAPRNAVLRIRINGNIPADVRRKLSAVRLRSLSPPEMNLEVFLPEDRPARPTRKGTGRSRPREGSSPQLSVFGPQELHGEPQELRSPFPQNRHVLTPGNHPQ